MEHLSLFLNPLSTAPAMSAPHLVLRCIAAAVIKEYISNDWLAKHLGDKSDRPILNAVGIGALLPICSCSVIPVGVGVQRAGAARGTAISFMASSPAISPVAVIMVRLMLGPVCVATYAGVALIGSFLTGLIGNRLLCDQMSPVANFDDTVDRVKEEDGHHAVDFSSGDAPRLRLIELGYEV